MSVTASQQTAMDSAVRHLVTKYNPQGNRVGWLMMSSILVEAWDLYSIAFVLIFIRDLYHPDPFLLGLAAAGTQGGALIGALVGGWLSDKIGRRVMFLSTMIMFIIFALAQAFVPSIGWLVVIRLILGIPLGSDISNGYTYIMESMPKGEREVMGNRWQFMFAIGEVMTLAVIAVFIVINLPHDLVWRVTLAMGAIPAAVILWMRHDLPETAVWLVRRGRFKEAKHVSKQMFNDNLDMLPDQDITVPHPHATAFLSSIRKDPIRWRATLYGWIACFAQATEFSTFAFYLPVLFVMVGVSSILGTNLVTMLLYIIAAIAGWVGPIITPKIGHRGIGIAGFGIVLVSLLVAAWALYSHTTAILPFAAAAMLWGHYWDASNCMTIPTMVAKPEYRGTASGFAYMFVKLPSFLSIFLFPALFGAIGQANATLFVAIFPLIGLLAAIFILPEVYGYEQD
ncbi:MFS transporter [Acidisphaera sp. S103]|uniref:MFS transporter n=1 Tax=Acidisphaera sp. S103 TaxID=1747223 RepID=UPI001C203664|nr:MFS transporter [Acidisphaera sp. S103]